MIKKEIKKRRFEKWLVVSSRLIPLLFIMMVAIFFYVKKNDLYAPAFFSAISPLIITLVFFIPSLFILNLKLPSVEKKIQLFSFIGTFLLVMFLVYFFMAIILFHYLYNQFLPKNLLLLRSTVLIAMILLLIYRISLYFEGIIPKNLKEHLTVQLKSILNSLSWFKLNVSTFLTINSFIEKLKMLLLDFIGVAILISIFTLFYGVVGVPDFTSMGIYLVGSFIAIFVEFWFWWGLVQNRYWKLD